MRHPIISICTQQQYKKQLIPAVKGMNRRKSEIGRFIFDQEVNEITCLFLCSIYSSSKGEGLYEKVQKDRNKTYTLSNRKLSLNKLLSVNDKEMSNKGINFSLCERSGVLITLLLTEKGWNLPQGNSTLGELSL